MLTNGVIGENKIRRIQMNIYKNKILPNTDVIYSHVYQGRSMEELAQKIGVTVSDITNCMKKYKQFAALVSSAEKAKKKCDDDAVENALFQRAIGFEQPDGKFSPPDVRAAMFWLKYRRPEVWDEKNKNNNFQSFELSELEEGL